MCDSIYNPEDTICAVSTPPGHGGIAVIRLSGKAAMSIADSVWRGVSLTDAKSHTAHLGMVVDSDGSILDECVATLFRAPKSYTGEDTVEFSVHGSRWIQKRIIELLCKAGARIALRGEFTRRAYSAGHLDLAQAEGVADLIGAGSKAAHDAALRQMRGGISQKLEKLRERLLHMASLIELELDFSDQEVEFVPRSQLTVLAEEIEAEINRLYRSFATGAAVKDGFPVAIIGPVNAGKSRLLNAILDEDRAIVSDIPGTTRDVVEDRCEVGDYTIRFLDTAGIRHTEDPIERIGIGRSHKAAAEAAVVLYLVDATCPEPSETVTENLEGVDKSRVILIVNKSDLVDAEAVAQTFELSGYKAIAASAATGEGVDGILKEVEQVISGQMSSTDEDDVLITAARHADALRLAGEAIREVLATLADPYIPTDLVAHHLRQTIHHLSSITGAITTPQILNNIFTSFCIGK